MSLNNISYLKNEFIFDSYVNANYFAACIEYMYSTDKPNAALQQPTVHRLILVCMNSDSCCLKQEIKLCAV